MLRSVPPPPVAVIGLRTRHSCVLCCGAVLYLTVSPSVAVDHSIVMYLMDRDGQFLEFFTQLADAKDISTKIAGIIKSKA